MELRLTLLSLFASLTLLPTDPPAGLPECSPSRVLFEQTGPSHPMLFHLSVPDSNGAGCDGCSVSWDVTVVWAHDGAAQVVDWDDDTFDLTVEKGDIDRYTGYADIDCGESSDFRATAKNDSSVSRYWVDCSNCQ